MYTYMYVANMYMYKYIRAVQAMNICTLYIHVYVATCIHAHEYLYIVHCTCTRVVQVYVQYNMNICSFMDHGAIPIWLLSKQLTILYLFIYMYMYMYMHV